MKTNSFSAEKFYNVLYLIKGYQIWKNFETWFEIILKLAKKYVPKMESIFDGSNCTAPLFIGLFII